MESTRTTVVTGLQGLEHRQQRRTLGRGDTYGKVPFSKREFEVRNFRLGDAENIQDI